MLIKRQNEAQFYNFSFERVPKRGNSRVLGLNWGSIRTQKRSANSTGLTKTGALIKITILMADNILTHDESVKWHQNVQSSKFCRSCRRKHVRNPSEYWPVSAYGSVFKSRTRKILRFEKYGATMPATLGRRRMSKDCF